MADISPADPTWTGPAYDTRGSLTELGEDECLALLGEVPVGRVLISVGALPTALPVNHRVVDGLILFRSSPGSKLTAAVDGQVVGFEADAFDQATRSGWSVLAVGPAEVVQEPALLHELVELGFDTWYNHPSLFVAIHPHRISGRRITPTAIVTPRQAPEAGTRSARIRTARPEAHADPRDS